MREEVRGACCIREDVWENEKIFAEIWHSPKPKLHSNPEECSKPVLEQGEDKDFQDYETWKLGTFRP